MRPSLAPPAALAVAALGLISALAAGPAAALEGPWHENPQSRVRLVSPYAEAPAAGPWRLGLEFETVPGWHVYWKNSGDAGYPPVVDFAATPGAGAVEIAWPAPERYLLPGDLEALGYEGTVVYPLALAIEPPAGGTLTLAADLDYLICEVDCIPYRYRLTLAQPVAAAGGAAVADPSGAELLAAWEARLPRPAAEAGVVTEAALEVADAEAPVLEVRVRNARAAADAQPALFLEADETFDFGVPERAEPGEGGDLLFRVPAPWWQVPDPLPAAVELAWTVTGLAGGDGAAGAMAIEARRTVPLTAGGLPDAPAQPAGGASPGRLLLLLAGAFAGGLLLWLTPTLLPLALVRGLTLAGDEGDAAVRRGALATAGGAFAGALALAALGLAARGAGRVVTWGTQLQEPAVVAALALAATFLALGLWGIVGWPLGRRPAARPAGIAGGTAIGFAAAVLALPWSLPPLPGSIGPALAAGAGPAVAAFAALGLGLALPWLAVAAAPRLLAAARRRAADPGAVRRLAEGLGFVAAGAVVWLLYLLSRQLRSDGLALFELALLALALVAWVRTAARRRLLAAALAVVLAALAAAAVWVADTRRLVPRAEDDAVAAATLDVPTDTSR